MTRRLVIAAVTGCLLLSVTGCPAPEDRSAERTTPPPSAANELPGRPTDVTTDLPSYGGPPADAPPSSGPLTTLTAALDLSPAAPEPTAPAQYAVGAPDGGAYVFLGPGPHSLPRLATVGATTDGVAVTGWVPIPDIITATGLHLLPSGAVVVTSALTADDGGGLGFQVVDPVEGVLRTTIVHPFPESTRSITSASALSPDGGTLYLFSSPELEDFDAPADIPVERLFAVDVDSGAVLAERDLTDDVASVSLESAAQGLAALVARPAGGVTLVFQAWPVEEDRRSIPTLVSFDADLQPTSGPVRVAEQSEDAETYAVTTGFDGTVFLLAEVTDDVWITAVPDGGGAGPILVQLTSWFFREALFVEPAERWALLPSYEGAVAVDLTTGELGARTDLGCLPGRRVRAMSPGTDGAILLGECDPETPMLWFLGP